MARETYEALYRDDVIRLVLRVNPKSKSSASFLLAPLIGFIVWCRGEESIDTDSTKLQALLTARLIEGYVSDAQASGELAASSAEAYRYTLHRLAKPTKFGSSRPDNPGQRRSRSKVTIRKLDEVVDAVVATSMSEWAATVASVLVSCTGVPNVPQPVGELSGVLLPPRFSNYVAQLSVHFTAETKIERSTWRALTNYIHPERPLTVSSVRALRETDWL